MLRVLGFYYNQFCFGFDICFVMLNYDVIWRDYQGIMRYVPSYIRTGYFRQSIISWNIYNLQRLWEDVDISAPYQDGKFEFWLIFGTSDYNVITIIKLFAVFHLSALCANERVSLFFSNDGVTSFRFMKWFVHRCCPPPCQFREFVMSEKISHSATSP